MNKPLTLYELNIQIRDIIEETMSESYWVQAELSDVRENNGHCYMELIQKDERSNTPIAKARASCWRNTWMLIRPYFERVTGQTMHSGMKVLLQVHAQFHENFGFSWIIEDINPEFTIGDMARKRLEIIRQLKEEGVYDLQKELHIPMFAQHIAVISSETAAGYGDFCDQLINNDFGFHFATRLYPAIMQGEGVEQSVISALNRINEDIEQGVAIDVVVIIRGGGATSDLSGFDTLELAENVANFPIPIITGIGHERDESVLDMISHTRVKTPTAAAALLIENLMEVWQTVQSLEDRITSVVSDRIKREYQQLEHFSKTIPLQFAMLQQKNQFQLDTITNNLRPLLKRYMMQESHQLEMLGQRIKALDPQVLLLRGYSITLHDGKAVRDVKKLKSGDEIETRVAYGTIKSIVK
ncbi:exodeoxyribonuclease VII large subunit [Segatella albensis]|uniref:exodeoxyribonuclease VII large subunit n=1 Tax=Segatella albensis TaxID=77768 RepID=UPI0004885616|nr:exodeoxyribonuclease VII large subunit [Segatella albensis]